MLALGLRWSNVLALLTLIIVASLLSPYFFDLRNIMNVLRGASVLCIVAVGMTLVILSRGVDLSAGSILGMSGATLALMAAIDAKFAIAAALGAGVAVGLANGVLIAYLGLQPFIATVATLIATRGLVYIVSDGANIIVRDPPAWFEAIGSGHLGPVPIPILIAATVVAVFIFVLTQTPFGRHVTMIGGNPVAAFRAGIKVDRLVLISFILAGAIAGLAGWLLAIRTSGATANLGTGLLFNAFAAVVIGGVSLKGGVGTLPGVYAGVLLLSSINTAMRMNTATPPSRTQRTSWKISK